MKKLNLICASIAVLFAAGAAQAGTATATATSMAIENFGPTATSALPAQGGAITYTMGTITAVNAGSTIYFTVRLTGGKFAGTAPTPTAAVGAFKFGGATCSDNSTAAVVCALTLSTDRSTIKVAVTPAATTTLGLGAFVFTPAAAAIDSVNTTLSSVGGKVSASIGVVVANPASIEATVAQDNIDGNLGTGDLITAARAITPIAGAPVSTVQIDLTTTPAGRSYTATQAPLARVRFSEVPGVKQNDTGDYVLKNTTSVVTVLTPGAGQVWPVGAILQAFTSATCATPVGTGTTTVLVADVGTAKSLTTADIVPTTGNPLGDPVVVGGVDFVVCMTAPTPAPNVATPIQATISATILAATYPETTDGIGAATGTGYDLQYNGSTVNIATYWPGLLESRGTGYAGYVRLTNTGAVPAAVSASHINPATGAVIPGGVLNLPGTLPNGILAAGQSVLVSTAQIDGTIGAAPSGFQSGRIRFTAPTNGLRAQSFLQDVARSTPPIEYKNPQCLTSGTIAGGAGTVSTSCASVGNN